MHQHIVPQDIDRQSNMECLPSLKMGPEQEPLAAAVRCSIEPHFTVLYSLVVADGRRRQRLVECLIGMAMMPEPKQAQLSIWRDFAPTAPVGMHDTETGWRLVTRESRLQEGVYSWPLPIDAFGGVDDENVRDDLRKALLHRLDASLPPTQRGVNVLCEFVAKAERAIKEGHSGPLPSDSASEAPSAHTSLEPNPLLALTVHIKWLVRCFGDRPNVSVIIR